jgi:tubulin polyglutamylase TTLL6/13
VDPLQIYLFKEGMARLSTDSYKEPTKKNMKNMFMHLTNYSINSKNKGKFQFNKNIEDSGQGHKRFFSSVLDFIRDTFPDGDSKVEILLHNIEKLVIKTLLTVQPSLKHYLNVPNKG